jgi:tetratricopeptide (TPR) repeat protein
MKSGIFALVTIGTLALPNFGIGAFERGNRLYRQGKFADAATAYLDAIAHGKNTPEVHYNLGTALLQLGKYKEAEQHLKGALTSVDPIFREKVYYNLGNRFLEEARGEPMRRDTAQKNALLDSAVVAYKQALRLQPPDRDAKWNLELALRDQKKDKQSGGGGGQQNQSQDQNQKAKGGGGGNGRSQSPTSPSGQQQGATPEKKPMSPDQADRILSAAEQDERQLYKERLKKGQREMPVTRDW